MVAAAAAGFRAIALDLPGYGLSEPPADLAQATWEGVMNDLLAILDSLSISKVSIGGKFCVMLGLDTHLSWCKPKVVHLSLLHKLMILTKTMCNLLLRENTEVGPRLYKKLAESYHLEIICRITCNLKIQDNA